MRLLLDTHVMLWFALGDTRLRPTARETISAADLCFVSVASIWEIAIKSSLGRGLSESIGAEHYVELIDIGNFQTLAISISHVVAVERLPKRHGDPFDRLMVAQSIADDLTFMTHDRTLAAYGELVMVV